jgi:hypothetical protein
MMTEAIDYYTLRLISLIDDWFFWRVERAVARRQKAMARYERFNAYYEAKSDAFLEGYVPDPDHK